MRDFNYFQIGNDMQYFGVYFFQKTGFRMIMIPNFELRKGKYSKMYIQLF